MRYAQSLTACAEPLPDNARITIAIVPVDRDERKKPVTMCADHQQEWNGGT